VTAMTSKIKTAKFYKAIIRDMEWKIERYEVDIAALEEKLVYLEYQTPWQRIKRFFRL
jgi:hypothetical protein